MTSQTRANSKAKIIFSDISKSKDNQTIKFFSSKIKKKMG